MLSALEYWDDQVGFPTTRQTSKTFYAERGKTFFRAAESTSQGAGIIVQGPIAGRGQ